MPIFLLMPLFWATTPACDDAVDAIRRALQASDKAEAMRIVTSTRQQCAGSGSFLEAAGITSEMSGNLRAAEEAFAAALQLDPKSPRLLTYLGATYVRENKLTEAIRALDGAIVLDSSNTEAAKYLIAAYVQSNDWRSAAAVFVRSGAAEKPRVAQDPLVFLWLARAFIETNQSASLDKLLALPRPESPPALLFSLGTLFARHGMYERAVDYLQRIPEGDADDAVHFNLGLACSHLRRFEAARKSYFRAIDKHPGHVEAYFHVGLDYASSGDPGKAIPWLLRAHEWSAGRSDISYALAEELLGLEYFDTAEQVLGTALQSGSNDPLLLVANGDLKQAKGDTDAAIASYQKVLASHPDLAAASIGLARAHLSQGKDKEAAGFLDAVLAKEPGNPAANGELGFIEIRRGEWESALAHLTRAWAGDHSNPKVALELGRALMRMGRPGEALRVLTSPPATMRDTPAFHMELARVYTRLRRSGDAEAERAATARLQEQAQGVLRFASPGAYVQ